MKRNTERRESGQVLAIVALLMVAMVGMVGLAIDGGRVYVERRVVQNASDAAALAAADVYWSKFQACATAGTCQKDAVTAAFDAAQYEFGVQVGLPNGFGAPATTSVDTNACTDGFSAESQTFQSGGYGLTLTAIPVAGQAQNPGLCAFNANGTAQVTVFFINVLNQVGSVGSGATATAVSGHTLKIPTLLVLDTDCSNAAADWKIAGNSSIAITGSAWSDGNISDQGSLNVTITNGNAYQSCQAFPTKAFTFIGGGTSVDPSGYFADPLASWVTSTFASTCGFSCPAPPSPYQDSTSGTHVELRPGTYSSTNSFGNGCWFLAPGIYNWNASDTSGAFKLNTHNTILSNELTPPGVLDPTTNLNNNPPLSTGDPVPFNWDVAVGNQTMTCDGGIAAYTCTYVPLVTNCPGADGANIGAGGGVTPGKYFFRVTSLRKEASGLWRESFPSSMTKATAAGVPATNLIPGNNGGCIEVDVPTSNETVQIGISNPPGMGNTGDTTEYHVYANQQPLLGGVDGCTLTADHFGYVTTANFQNDPTSGTTSYIATVGTPNSSKSPNQTTAQLTSAVGSTGCPFLPAKPVTGLLRPNTGFQSSGNCTLGYVASTIMDGTLLGSGFTASGVCGLEPTFSFSAGCEPAYLGNTLSSDKTTDVGNEDYCLDTTNSYCPDDPKGGSSNFKTPGGVMFIFANTTACIFQTQGVPYVFGGLQYDSVVLYAQAPSGWVEPADPTSKTDCGTNGANINGSDGGQFIGQVYIPAALLTVAGSGAPIDGGIVVWQFQVAGGSNTSLTGRFAHTKKTIPGRLVQCTNGGVGPGYTASGNTYCPKP